MESIIVKTQALKKHYQMEGNIVKAVDGIDFEVAKREFVAIIGTSGSGKSTLLHMLGGLETPSYGQVFINDQNLAEMNREELTIFRRRQIGFIFQNYNLIPDLTVYQNIIFPLELDGAFIDTNFVNRIIATLKLTDKKDIYPNKLSGGEQQRIAIARALITKPAIILADEPTGNLDTISSHEVIGLLKTLSKQFQQTIILITHDQDIAQMADRIVRIEDGKLIKGRDYYARK